MSTYAEYQVYAKRRKALAEHLAQQYDKAGIFVLCGSFEAERYDFHQEANFFYFTGIAEPGLITTIEIPSGHTIIWEPAYTISRQVWSVVDQPCTLDTIERYGFQEYRVCGDSLTGMSVGPYADLCHYQALQAHLDDHMRAGGLLFVVESLLVDSEQIPSRYLQQRLFASFEADFENCKDIGVVVQDMRRTKDASEITQIKAAITVTALAHEQAALGVQQCETEAQIRARIIQSYVASGAQAAFPSIVASGKQATILHYNRGNRFCADGELVLVDIGAQVNYYCADITRMYHVGGHFTAHQKELYELVLLLQKTIQRAAIPGIWLAKAPSPERSLQCIAYDFLKKHGFGPEVMPHSIGHWLGLEVHDVGDYSIPLREGDAFTIEPGIYVPEEGVGIRIEDNYWICNGAAQCLSLEIPKAL